MRAKDDRGNYTATTTAVLSSARVADMSGGSWLLIGGRVWDSGYTHTCPRTPTFA